MEWKLEKKRDIWCRVVFVALMVTVVALVFLLSPEPCNLPGDGGQSKCTTLQRCYSLNEAKHSERIDRHLYLCSFKQDENTPYERDLYCCPDLARNKVNGEPPTLKPHTKDEEDVTYVYENEEDVKLEGINSESNITSLPIELNITTDYTQEGNKA
ncbi:unnamed protein product [Diamesa serratosioi]